MARGRSILGKREMAAPSATLHEASEKPGAEATDRYRVIASFVEKLEAFDFQYIHAQVTRAH